MLALVIETSTELGLAAVVKDGRLLYECRLPTGQQNSKYLLPGIQNGLKELDLKIKDFDFIAVGVGPGSYTGIRIGVMVAKTLTFATEIPLVALCTLQTFVPEADGCFAVLIDAKISGAYVVIGEKRGQRVTYRGEPQVIELGQLSALLQGIDRIISPCISRLKPVLDRDESGQAIAWEVKGPDCLQIYQSAKEKFVRGEFTTDGQVDILYLRKTQAEIEREIKKNPPL